MTKAAREDQKSSSSSSSSSLLPKILSGSIGSMAVALAVTPLEVVKIRQQMSSSPSSSLNIRPTSFRGIRVGCLACQECGSTILLNNGLMECVLPLSSSAAAAAAAALTATPATRTPATIASRQEMGTLSSTLVSIFKHEGIAGLYAGLRPTLVMSVPNTVLYFTAYDELSLRMRELNNNYHQPQQQQQHQQYQYQYQSTYTVTATDAATQAAIPLIAGSTARLLASLVTAPLELVRTRQAGWSNTIQQNNNQQRRRGMVEELLYLTRSNGILSLYSGLAPTLWRDVPFSAIYWLCLEQIRNALSSSHENTLFLGKWGGYYYKMERNMDDMPPIVDAAHSFVSGAIAGSIAAAFTTPFDVVKTRRQIMIGESMSSSKSSSSLMDNVFTNYDNRRMCIGSSRLQQQRGVNIGELGTFGHMRHIAQEEGIVGLWKGNVTRMLKVAPACAIMISCYEFGKRIFTL